MCKLNNNSKEKNFFKIGYFYNWRGSSTLEHIETKKVANWDIDKNPLGDEFVAVEDDLFTTLLTTRLKFEAASYSVYFFIEQDTVVIYDDTSNKIVSIQDQTLKDFEPIVDVNKK